MTLAVRVEASASSTAASAKKETRSSASAKKTTARKAKKRLARKSRSWRSRGQQSMHSSRIREIQEALIRESYLAGEADGVWGPKSKEAMTRFQEDHGWQAKVVPDSRALIKLGLGPDRSAVINPESLQSGIPSEGIAQVQE
jgi:peptidoglycan hydrolase-like protein with peptidoglycan-binding domain